VILIYSFTLQLFHVEVKNTGVEDIMGLIKQVGTAISLGTILAFSGITDIGFSNNQRVAHAAETASKSTYKKFRRDAKKNDVIKLQDRFNKYEGFDVNVPNAKGETALIHAINKGSFEAIEWLLINGADPNIVSQGADTPLAKLVTTKYPGNGDKRLRAINLALEKGAEVDGTSKNGITPLMYAAGARMGPVVDLLLQKGANLESVTPEGYTPVMASLVFSSGNHKDSSLIIPKNEMVEKILSKSPDITKRVKYNGDNLNALQMMAEFSKGVNADTLELFKMVSRAGADVKAITSEGLNIRDTIALENNGEIPSYFASFFDSKGVSHTAKYEEKKKALALQKLQEQALRNPNAPLPCGQPTLTGLTQEEGAAVQYLIEQKHNDPYSGPVAGKNFCIESITAQQKIPIRGNTVVKYKAIFNYVRGWRTQCLPQNNRKTGDYWRDYEKQIACSPFSGKKRVV